MKTRIIREERYSGEVYYCPQYKWLGLKWKNFTYWTGCGAGSIKLTHRFYTIEKAKQFLWEQKHPTPHPNSVKCKSICFETTD